MPADPLQVLDALLHQNLPPEDLTRQATLIISQALNADWAGLYAGNSDAHVHQVIYHHPEMPTPLLAYLEQRTRTLTPLARVALEHPHPTFVDHYKEHPDARQGAVALGVSAVAHLPLGHRDGLTYIATVLRLTASPTLVRSTPWTENERTLMTAAARRIQVALTRKTR
jgi:GAF domain-containing protein